MIKHQLLSELLWIVLAAIVAAGIILPPVLGVGPYEYMVANFWIIAGFVFIARLLFFATQSPIFTTRVSKGLGVIAVVPAILFVISNINGIQTYVDAEGYAQLFGVAETPDAITWGKYVRNEFVFFGASLLISLIALPAVLVVALWLQVKRSGVGALPT